MAKKTKEKRKDTNDEIFDFNREIVIGMKTMPERKSSSKKKHVNKKTSNRNERKIEQKEKIKQKQPKILTRKQELAIKKRKAIFKVVKWTTIILIIIVGGIAFLFSPVFNIKEITVSGNSKITKEEIISLSGIQMEENTFKLKQKEIEIAVKQNAYISTVKLKRKLPTSVEIQVVERKPIFMLQFANAYVYINSQGYLLEVTDQKANLPIITGYLTKQEEIHEGERMCAEDLQRLGQVLQIIESAENNDILKHITKINIADKQNYILELGKEKKTVHVGDASNLSTKMLYIIKIVEEEKGKEGEIFVNTDLNSKGAVWREKI